LIWPTGVHVVIPGCLFQASADARHLFVPLFSTKPSCTPGVGWTIGAARRPGLEYVEVSMSTTSAAMSVMAMPSMFHVLSVRLFGLIVDCRRTGAADVHSDRQ
jgi:hypothetical protein